MKNTFLLFTIIIVGILSCKNNKAPEDKLKINLIGKWGGLGEKPIWDIRSDSFYFIEPALSYHYQLFGDTLIVNYPDKIKNLNFGKIRIDGDTLFMHNYKNNFTTISYRYKK